MRRAGELAGSRTGFVAILLMAALVLGGALGWQALQAVASHQSVTENVLRDYARLAAGEFVRRTANEVGYYGYYPLAMRLTQVGPQEPLPTRDALGQAADARIARAATLMAWSFRYDRATRGLEASAPGPTPAIRDWLVDRLAAITPPDAGAHAVIHDSVDGRFVSFVIATPPAAAGSTDTTVGFEVAAETLGPWLQRVFDRAPLLPPSLTKGRDTNTHVHIRVTDPGDAEVFRAGNPGYLSYGAERAYGEAYQGVFDGLVARAWLDPAAAPDLAIGGLPYSRVPMLLGLMALTAGLLVTAMLQLRRERAVARMRTDFVSRVSHELRTPLTQIRMYGETLLLGRVRSADERRRSLEIIDRESRRLSNLVENILQFSRRERGTVRLAPEERRLEPLLRELVEEFAPLAGEGTRVELGAVDPAVVSVDAEAFRQIVLNLLDNAVKYGPDGQTVRVAATAGAGTVRVVVEDQGPGVPPKQRKRIWFDFERLERDRASAVAGTGIGLSVVRELTQLHGGRAWVEAAEGGGSRFVVELPRVAAAETAPAKAATAREATE